MAFHLHAPSSPLRPERQLRWHPARCLLRWRSPPQGNFAEANFAGLHWVEAYLGVSGCSCRRPQFVAGRLCSQEPYKEQVTRQRGPPGDGGTRPFSKGAYGVERYISWLFHCSFFFVLSLSCQFPRLARTVPEGILGNLLRGCLSRFGHVLGIGPVTIHMTYSAAEFIAQKARNGAEVSLSSKRRRRRGKAYNARMEIRVKLPDDLAEHRNPGQEALEALVVEGYRAGALSHYQASQLLGLSRIAFDGFLKERGIHEHAYSVDDLKEDEETLRQLESKDASRR